MPTKDITSEFCHPRLIIQGLRTPTIYINERGDCDFGCVKCHISKIRNISDATIRLGGGRSAVQWWHRWKEVLIPLFEQFHKESVDYWVGGEKSTIESDLTFAEGDPAMALPHLYNGINNQNIKECIQTVKFKNENKTIK